MSSEKYSKFLITKSVEGLSKEEQSKVKTLFMRNPLNRFKPGRIIALGPQESSSVSWKEVYRIHVSDITKSRTDYDRTIAGLFSRLANTRGVLKIECVPGMPQGFIFDTAQKPPVISSFVIIIMNRVLDLESCHWNSSRNKRIPQKPV